MNILFVCASNKDRSPALVEYFKAAYHRDGHENAHEFRGAGVNRYFTNKHRTHLLTSEDVRWAEIIVYAEDVHRTVANRLVREEIDLGYPIEKKTFAVLNLGEFKEGPLGDDYLLKAYERLQPVLNVLTKGAVGCNEKWAKNVDVSTCEQFGRRGLGCAGCTDHEIRDHKS
jgi:predicted protein tyrosine phosphatase